MAKGKGRNEVGQALLKIVPDAREFIKDLNSQMKAIEKSLPQVTIDVDADTSRARAQIEALHKQRPRVTVDVGVDGEKAAERKIDRAARDRRTKIYVDTDVSSLDKMIASMRREHEILSDIAVLKARMGSMDDDEFDAAGKRLRALNEELSIRQKLVQASKATGRNAGGDVASRTRDLEAAYKALGREADLRKKLWDAERNHNDGLAEQIRTQISLKNRLGSIIEEYGEAERRQQLAEIKHDWRRRALLKDNVQIEKERAAARERDDRRALGRLKAEQQMRRAEGLDSRGRAGVMMNTRGITLFNISNITAAVAGVGSLVAALGGVVAAAGAAATALGAMGAVVGVGAGRVFGAFSALRSASSEASSGAQAASQYQSALDRVHDSQRNAADSVKDLRKAQEDLGRAYGQASREIRDQNMELRDAALSQEEAAIGVARARQRLAQTIADRRAGKASDLDVQEARVGVDRAQLSLRSAQHRFKDQKTDTAVANRKGVEGSDTVQQAKSAVEDRQRGVADALRDVARAQRDLATAAQSGGPAVDRFNEAMAKLSPSARSFVNSVRAFGPAWSELRSQTEEALFANLGSTITEVGKRQLPELQRGFVTLAGTLNGVVEDSIRRVDATFQEFSANGTYDAFLSSVGQSFSGFSSTLDGVVRALTILTVEAGPSIGRFFQEFGVFLTEGAQMWGEFGGKTMDGLTRLLPMFNRFSAVLLPIAEIILPALEKAFGMLVQRFESSGGQAQTTVRAIADAFLQLMQAAMPLIPPLLQLVTTLARGLASIPTPVLTGLIAFFLASRTGMQGIIGISNQVERMSKALMVLQGLPTTFAKIAAGGGMIGKTMTALTGIMSALKGGIVAVGVAIKAAFIANPVGLVLATVAALVAGIVLFFTKTEVGRKMWGAFWDWLKRTGTAFLDWLKRTWPIILAILTGPIGVAVLLIVKNWDKIKGAFNAALTLIKNAWNVFVAFLRNSPWVKAILNPIDTLKRAFAGLGDFIKNAFRVVARNVVNYLTKPLQWIGKLLQQVGRIPGAGKLRQIGGSLASINASRFGLADGGPVPTAEVAPGGFIVNAAATQKNRGLLESLFPGGSVVRGPGTGRSDSILGMFGGVGTSWVSNGEYYIPPVYAPLFGIAAGINGGNGNGLPRYDKGGQVGSPYEQLGSAKWNDQWLNYFHSYSEEGKAWDRGRADKGDRDYGSSNDLTPKEQREAERARKYQQDRDKAFQKWLDSSGNRRSYSSGGLPPGVTMESIRAVEGNKKRDQEQINKEKAAKAEWAKKREQELKEFNAAWFKYFEANGGDANRDKYLARNPQINDMYRNGQFPPGSDGRTVRPVEYDPTYENTYGDGPGLGDETLGDPPSVNDGPADPESDYPEMNGPSNPNLSGDDPTESFASGGQNAKQAIIVHTTEGDTAEGAKSALRSSGNSYHVLIDENGKEHRLVSDDAQASAAMGSGNRVGLHVALTGRVGQQWSDVMTSTLAARMSKWSSSYGIPLTKLSPEELKSGKKGVAGHADVSKAWGETDHTDPGPSFDYEAVFAKAAQESPASSGAYKAEPYGLPAGTNTGGYGSGGDIFPDWVSELAQAFSVKPSTYPGHQESSRNEPGYAPNPQGLNRGIDWVGSVGAMQSFADYLHSIAPKVEGLEQIIWQNPQTGQKVGWSGRTPDTNGSYFANDYGGHQDHVHSRQSTSLPSSASALNAAPGNDYDSLQYPDMSGDGEDIYGTLNPGTTSDGEQDKGIVESTAMADATVNGKFSPKRYAQNVGSKAIGYTWDAALEFFGLSNSILSDDHDYWQIANSIKEENKRLQEKKGAPTKNAPDVGTGAENDPRTGKLQEGFIDPNGDKDNPAYRAPGPNLPRAGGLKSSSSPEEIAAVILGESQSRGYKQPDEGVAKVALGMQESGLDPAAIGGGGAWHGIFQQDTSYPGRDNPNTNITGFMDRLDEKTKLDPAADIWKRIFWLQQRPGEKTAEAAYQNGRKAYMDEIKSKEGEARAMYDRVVKKYHTGGKVGGRKEVPAILLEDEFVTNPDSADEAGPLLEFINGSPGNARAAMEALSGPAGAAANVVAPGSGALVSAAMAAGAGAVESGMKPAADFLSKTIALSADEYQALIATGRRHPMAEVPVGPKVQTPPMGRQVIFNGDMIAYDTNRMVRKLEDSSIAAATGVLGGRGF